MTIPKSHPRYKSLVKRGKIVSQIEKGLAVNEGLIAHGRGEAFDYLLGEKTIPQAHLAERAAAAYLLNAIKPVISVNGNAAALAAKEIVVLSKILNAKLEANVFYGSREKRVALIIRELKKNGAKKVFGAKPDARIPGMKSNRGRCSREGIYSGDVVLVPLEDGDRAKALARMGKVVISIDLNPLSRTSQSARVSIVDELSRALPVMIAHARRREGDEEEIKRIIDGFDNRKNLSGVLEHIASRLGTH